MFFLRLYLWAAPHVLLAIFLVRFLRLERQKDYPIFFAYVLASLAQFVALISINLLLLRSLVSLATYRWALVVSTGLIAVAELAVLYELANVLILSRSSLGRLLRPLLRWAGALLLVAAVGSSALLHENGIDRAMKVFDALDFASSLISIGLVATLLMFSRFLRVSWRGLASGVALGFAILGVIELAAATLLAKLGHSYYVRIDLLRLFGFHLAVLVWLIYMFLPRGSAGFTGNRLDQSRLQAWNEELQGIVRQ